MPGELMSPAASHPGKSGYQVTYSFAVSVADENVNVNGEPTCLIATVSNKAFKVVP